jgi:glucosamine kinase
VRRAKNQQILTQKPDSLLTTNFAFFIGVDGGGTGTRVRVETPDGNELGRGKAGPSGLAHGAAAAWSAVQEALDAAFAQAGAALPAMSSMAIGLGLAGVHNLQWAQIFKDANPGFGALAVASDGYTTLLGAHLGRPGAIIAIGTGSIGEVLDQAGQHREVSGWGFPAGDEAGGAWIGLRAINHAQRMLDGRDAYDAFGQAVIDFCGEGRNGLFDWLARANQTEFARLAPLVVEYAGRDAVATAIMAAAGNEIDHIARALDPGAQLPVALCGGLAQPLQSYLSASLAARITAPQGDAAAGALRLIRDSLQGKPHHAH